MSSVGESLRESAIFNLAGAVTMVVDDSSFSLDLTCNALLGFGIQTRYACHGALEAMDILQDQNVDLILVDCDMPGMDGIELVRWLRRSDLDPNAYAPVIMTAGHLNRGRLNAARDCGANFVITKPFSATTLLERVIWVARDGRPFLEVGDYKGPDRRFRDMPPPGEERRADRLRKLAAEQAAADQSDAA
jgi:CheY-like chemotaxis protein